MLLVVVAVVAFAAHREGVAVLVAFLGVLPGLVLFLLAERREKRRGA
jgi:hypothetical protein